MFFLVKHILERFASKTFPNDKSSSQLFFFFFFF